MTGKKNDKKVTVICFSPGGTTKKILIEILKGMKVSANWIDLTKSERRSEIISSGINIHRDEDIVLFGFPVYGGDIPATVLQVLKRIMGQGVPAAAVVNYGNRDFGFALKRLTSQLSKNGFVISGAAAFISEHSFSTKYPIAKGRPDKEDLNKALQFGAELVKKLTNHDFTVESKIPGRKEILLSILPAKGPAPDIETLKCNKCGICAAACPMGLLSTDTMGYFSSKSKKECLGCMSCINRCPDHARYFTVPGLMDLFLNRFFKGAMSFRQEPFIVL